MDFAERIEEPRRPHPIRKPGERASEGGTAAGMLRLQRLAGNSAVTQAIQSGFAPVQRQDEELEEEELQGEQEMLAAQQEEVEEEEQMV